MAEYLIQSETLDDIADVINAKTGSSSAMTPAEMVTAIESISSKETLSWHQCPEAVRQYLAAVTANPYTDTGVAEILDANSSKVCDVVNGIVTIGGAVYYIRYMNRYPISIFDSSGTKMSNITWGSTPGLFTLGGTEYRYHIKTYVTDYAPDPANQANAKPVGYTIDGTTYHNNEPNVPTPFAATTKAGTLTALDHLRWFNTTDAAPDGNIYHRGRNCRDLGGWACDGGTIKYGMLVRSGEINAADKNQMVDKIGIKTEINLLPKSLQATSESVWGIERVANPTDSDFMYSLAYTDQWKLYLSAIFESVSQSRPVLFHCGVGADKTGTMSVMLMGLLGCSYSDIDSDFELTTFAEFTDWRNRSYTSYLSYLNAITQTPLLNGLYTARISSHTFELDGTTYTINYLGSVPISVTGNGVTAPVAESKFSLNGVEYVIEYDNASGQELYIVNAKQAFRNHCVCFALSLGISFNKINAFRTACIDGTPDTITADITAYTVTKNLNNVSTDNTATAVTKWQPYEADLAPAAGKVINQITVLMGGVDITGSVVKGDYTEVYRGVENALTNCSSANARERVIAGQSYVEDLTCDSGYEFGSGSITVTMGGVDVTNDAVILIE